MAKRELASILNDTKTPPTDDERVRGANFYRQHKEDAAALAQLDYVLKVNPTNPGAVVTRSFIFLRAKKYDEAARHPPQGDRADACGRRTSRRRSST